MQLNCVFCGCFVCVCKTWPRVIVQERPGRQQVKIGCETCGHIACICTLKRRHSEDCRFRKAATCTVGIECEHGRDTCPECDPCTCGAEIAPEDFG